MKGVHAFRYSGLVNARAAQIQSVTDAKTKKTHLELVRKTKTNANKPNKNTSRILLGNHGRQILKNVRGFMKTYRGDLKQLAARRASQLMRANRPLTAKQQRSIKQAKR